MNINNFFYLSSKLRLVNIQVGLVGNEADYIVPRENSDGFFCDMYPLHSGHYIRVVSDVLFIQYGGKKICDIMDCGTVGRYLISDKFRETIEENKLTGVRFYPVKVLDKKHNEIKGYHGLTITGRSGIVDHRKCDIIVENGIKYYLGFYPGIEEWDGSDFFLPKNYLGIIIDLKAAKAIKDANLQIFT